MIALVVGWVLGWFVYSLSDAIPQYLHVSNGKMPVERAVQTPRPTDVGWQLAAGSLGAGWLFWVSLHHTMVQTAVLGGLFAFLLLIALIDLKYRRILNIITYPAFLLAILFSLNTQFTMHLAGGVFAFSIFLMAALTTRGSLGGGDVKLAALLGVIFGLPQIIWVLLAGTGCGAVVAIGMLLTKQGQRTTRIPYAPFLCVGAGLVLLLS